MVSFFCRPIGALKPSFDPVSLLRAATKAVSLTVGHFCQMLAVALSTVVTLGFSSINVAIIDGRPNPPVMMVVTANLMVGYFILAGLVARLTILFQTMGPGYVPPKKR